jgi:hypothetical protein
MKMLWKLINVESNFWRADNGKNPSFKWFSKFKSVVTSIDAECSLCPLINKTNEIVD